VGAERRELPSPCPVGSGLWRPHLHPDLGSARGQPGDGVVLGVERHRRPVKTTVGAGVGSPVAPGLEALHTPEPTSGAMVGASQLVSSQYRLSRNIRGTTASKPVQTRPLVSRADMPSDLQVYQQSGRRGGVCGSPSLKISNPVSP